MLAALTFFLFWLTVGLLALVLVLICIPVHLKMKIGSEPALAASLELRLLSGRAPRLFLIDSARSVERRKRMDDGPEKAKPKKRKKRRLAQGWASRLRPAEIARAIPALLGDTLSEIHFDRLRVQMEFGFADPADTGRVFGQLVPLAYLPINPAVSLDVKPNFENSCLKGNADAALHFVPVRLAVPAMRFAWRQFVVRS